MRVAHRMGSAYEWTHHVSRARILGISDVRIRDMSATPTGEDGLIARAVDALFDEACLPPDIERAISAAMGTKAVFDLIATVGFYCVLGCILMTFNTPIDEGVAVEIEKQPL
ncbi:carboxymuconolactone decarboxylase family protein [Mesorhizobium australicum]|uniref:carboxymuconolactone decarboxylase family protein n=1 Tax=Mesorhizobium australicum TaxID=536018 RepID=UPI003336DD89